MHSELNRIVLYSGKQKELLERAINIAGTERKLSILTGIPKGTIYNYKKELTSLPRNRVKILTKLTNIDIDKQIKKILHRNWGRKKGGLACYKLRLENGTFAKSLKILKKRSSIVNSKWHKEMKKNNPIEYYQFQYNAFKKVAGYKYLTKRGESVRNILEKEVGDALHEKNINYEYEPLVIIKEKAFFPDFKINKKIIEVTMWRGYSKIEKLKEKEKMYKSKGYKMILVVTEKVKKYYLGNFSNIVIGAKNLVNETF